MAITVYVCSKWQSSRYCYHSFRTKGLESHETKIMITLDAIYSSQIKVCRLKGSKLYIKNLVVIQPKIKACLFLLYTRILDVFKCDIL